MSMGSVDMVEEIVPYLTLSHNTITPPIPPSVFDDVIH